MRCNQPLNQEQQQFAEDNHSVVYSFLRYKRLDYDYYDAVIFGYIRAVQKYFNRPELRQYSFNTIAFAAMRSDLINHYRKQSRLKRRAYVISLDVMSDDGYFNLSDSMPADNTSADAIACNQLLEEISAMVSPDQFCIIQMKSQGYSDREIANSLQS